MIQKRWRLRCFGRNEVIEIPDQTPREIFEGQPDSPKDTWPITVVCSGCARKSEYSRQDARLEPIQLPDQGKQVDLLWRVVFRCDHGGYEEEMKIYTSAGYFHDSEELE